MRFVSCRSLRRRARPPPKLFGGGTVEPRTGGVRSHRDPPLKAPNELTATNARILCRVAAGDTNDEIGSALYLSRQAVAYHVASLLRALDARNRVALVARAYALGLLRPHVWPPLLQEAHAGAEADEVARSNRQTLAARDH